MFVGRELVSLHLRYEVDTMCQRSALSSDEKRPHTTFCGVEIDRYQKISQRK